jgi:tRNA(Ile2) C34 agmatinyltransferase TiaS
MDAKAEVRVVGYKIVGMMYELLSTGGQRSTNRIVNVEFEIDGAVKPKSTPGETAVSKLPAAVSTSPVVEMEAPTCIKCGTLMRRNGSCHACPECGSTSGCS